MLNTRWPPSLGGASLCEEEEEQRHLPAVFQDSQITGGSGSQPELVGHFGGDVFEGDGRARDPLEAHAVE